jgi:hypothetical protein
VRIISHRGNLEGPKPDSENTPAAVLKALASGFDVEIDVWGVSTNLWLGHDKPLHPLHPRVYQESRNLLWFHCKNLEALEMCLELDLHCFAHVTDPHTLTSRGYIWTYPGNPICPLRGVYVSTTRDAVPHHAFGVCTDWPSYCFELQALFDQ